jgi:hypothetical protein
MIDHSVNNHRAACSSHADCFNGGTLSFCGVDKHCRPCVDQFEEICSDDISITGDCDICRARAVSTLVMGLIVGGSVVGGGLLMGIFFFLFPSCRRQPIDPDSEWFIKHIKIYADSQCLFS